MSKIDHSQDDLFLSRLSSQLNPKHPMLILMNQIDWCLIEDKWEAYFRETKVGRKAKPARLIAGLLILQHVYALSDEQVVDQWTSNPYFQHFCGYDYLEWEAPIHPTSLTRWRQRIGEEGVLELLKQTVMVGFKMGVIYEKSVQNVIVDTTVQEKNIAHPSDAKLMDRARSRLVGLCKKAGVHLRQNYNKLSKLAVLMSARYAHASQFKRMRRQVKNIKNYLGRIVRDIERKIDKKVS
jgi:IS5 family transposase